MTALPKWPVSAIEEAMCRLGGRRPKTSTFGAIADSILTPRDLQTWLYAAASRESLEAEPLHVRGEFLEDALRAAGPTLVVISWGVLALRSVRGKKAVLLCPDGGEKKVPLATVCSAVRKLWEKKLELASLDAIVERANITTARKEQVTASLLRLQLAARPIEAGWVIRPASGAPLTEQLRHLGQGRNLLRLALGIAALQLATIGAWYLIGRGAFSGNYDPGLLVGWAIAMMGAAALKVATGFWEGIASIAIGGMLKKRILLGALRMKPSTLRHEGMGRSMGRVLEAQALEELSLSGGFLSVIAIFEFLVAIPILLRADLLLFAAIVAALFVILWACVTYYRRTAAWTLERLRLTHELIEQLVGHRTRIVQGDPRRQEELEDSSLEQYGDTSRKMDSFVAATTILIPRGVLIVGICALAPLFISGNDPASLWIGVGGVLLAQRALTKLANGVSSLFEAGVAWKSALPLLDAARTPEAPASVLGFAGLRHKAKPGEVLLETRQVAFRFSPDRAPVLRNTSLEINAGDHCLLEGGSGSGKSTLISVLGGLRAPDSGLVLLGGLDQQTLGAAVWRKKVTVAPQQFENHILQGTLAFNLLLGVEWPPTPEEMIAAEEVCIELGLGDVLDRMPSRLQQTVGSTGWRLSHGEQSRVYVARALLQGSELIILDESLAALDPENMTAVMASIRKRSRTLMLVAHP